MCLRIGPLKKADMFDILGITFPIFATIALGYSAVRFGVFAQSDMKILGKYVLNIALPALLCGAVAKRDLADVLQLDYALVFALGGLATFGLVYLVLWLQGTGPARRAIGAMGSCCPNSAYVGYPVMLLILPDHAGIVLALNFIVENFLLIPLGLMFLEGARDRDDRTKLQMLGGLFLSILKRPMFIGLLTGLLLLLLDIDLPDAGYRLLDMLAASASALALVMIGGSLVGLPLRGEMSLAVQILIGKLIVNPAMVILAAALLPLIGMPALSPDMWTAVVISAAMPMLVLYVVFAQEYGHEGVASIALLAATVGAFFTLSTLLFVLT